MTYPERYAAAASLSGALDLNARCDTDDWKKWNDVQLSFGNPPSVRGTGNDLFALAEKLAKRKNVSLPLYQCCGTEDGLHKGNVSFRDHATSLGLDLTYAEGAGAHEWGYWDVMIQKVLAWLPLKR